jgi:hypothetical protein
VKGNNVKGLPQMYWCETCEKDVDANTLGECIHCGDLITSPVEENPSVNTQVQDNGELDGRG